MSAVTVDIDELIIQHMYLAERATHQFRARAKAQGIDPQDLIGEAYLALVRVARSYDASKENGNGFGAYALRSITGYLRNYFRDRGEHMRPPRRIYELSGKISYHGLKDLREEEIAERLNVPLEDVRETLIYMKERIRPSLDMEIEIDGSDTTFHDLVGKSQDLSNVVVEEFLNQLNAQHRRILKLKVKKGMSQRDIGRIVGLSQMSISRILKRIERKLIDYQNGNEIKNEYTEDTKMNMESKSRLGFKAADIIRLTSKENVYIVGFDGQTGQAYGLKLTKQLRMDGRPKMMPEGYNITIAKNLLKSAELVMSNVPRDQIESGQATKLKHRLDKADSEKFIEGALKDGAEDSKLTAEQTEIAPERSPEVSKDVPDGEVNPEAQSTPEAPQSASEEEKTEDPDEATDEDTQEGSNPSPLESLAEVVKNIFGVDEVIINKQVPEYVVGQLVQVSSTKDQTWHYGVVVENFDDRFEIVLETGRRFMYHVGNVSETYSKCLSDEHIVSVLRRDGQIVMAKRTWRGKYLPTSR